MASEAGYSSHVDCREVGASDWAFRSHKLPGRLYIYWFIFTEINANWIHVFLNKLPFVIKIYILVVKSFTHHSTHTDTVH